MAYPPLFDVTDLETGETIATDVLLDECFPDDPEAVALAIVEIRRDGQCITGGGAAPLFRIVAASREYLR